MSKFKTIVIVVSLLICFPVVALEEKPSGGLFSAIFSAVGSAFRNFTEATSDYKRQMEALRGRGRSMSSEGCYPDSGGLEAGEPCIDGPLETQLDFPLEDFADFDEVLPDEIPYK